MGNLHSCPHSIPRCNVHLPVLTALHIPNAVEAFCVSRQTRVTGFAADRNEDVLTSK